MSKSFFKNLENDLKYISDEISKDWKTSYYVNKIINEAKKIEPEFFKSLSLQHNLYEEPDAYYLEIPMPGILKSNVHVELTSDRSGRQLAVSSSRKAVEGRKYLRHDIAPGQGTLYYSVPRDIQQENISAKLENGILTVKLLKLEKPKSKIVVE